MSAMASNCFLTPVLAKTAVCASIFIGKSGANRPLRYLPRKSDFGLALFTFSLPGVALDHVMELDGYNQDLLSANA